MIKKMEDMTEKDKAIVYDYAVYEIEELIKADIEDIKFEWLNPHSLYLRGKLNTYKEVLYGLTKDEKWLLTLEELSKVIFNNE